MRSERVALDIPITPASVFVPSNTPFSPSTFHMQNVLYEPNPLHNLALIKR